MPDPRYFVGQEIDNIVQRNGTMDVVLDVLDTFLLDKFYASVLPDKLSGGNTTESLDFKPPLNRHVKAYYDLAPSQWADSSIWKRDDLLRQYSSFFLIAL